MHTQKIRETLRQFTQSFVTYKIRKFCKLLLQTFTKWEDAPELILRKLLEVCELIFSKNIYYIF